MATLSRISPGQVVADRFLLRRIVGQGAAATVYEAEDRMLGELVALKALRSGPDALRELQVARRISHPNICRVHDVVPLQDDPEGATGQPPSTVLISMELLQGETLRSRIHREGALPIEEAGPLLEQFAAGLAAAHRADVVHGDLSARNLMLVAAEGNGNNEIPARLVITDFGLSQHLAPEALARDSAGEPDTLPGPVPGTLAYMAPEQLRGEAATPASDVYALGVLAFEMLTGTLPFGGMDRPPPMTKLFEPAPPLRDLCQGVPGPLADWLQRALATNAAERPTELTELLSLLRPAASQAARRFALLATLALTATVVGLVWWWAADRSSTTGGSERPIPGRGQELMAVAVLPFDHDPSPAAAFLAERLQRSLQQALVRSTELSVLSPASSAVLASQLGTADPQVRLALASDLGTRRTISGDIQQRDDGSGLDLELRLVDLASGEAIRSQEMSSESSEAFGLVEEAQLAVSEWLALSRAGPTSSPRPIDEAAARDLARGHQLLASSWGVGYIGTRREALQRALRLFRAAADRDSDSAEAQAAIALCEVELSLLPGGRPAAEHLEAANAAARASLELDGAQAEALAVLAYVEGMVGDLDTAQEFYGRASAITPGAALPPALWARVLERHRRWSEAASAAELAAERDPFSPQLLQLAAASQLILRRYARAEELLDTANRRFPELPLLYATRAVNAYYRTGRTDAALDFIARAQLIDADFLTPWFLMIEGRWQEARSRLLNNPLEAWDADLFQPKDLLLGYAEQQLGRDEDAMASLQRALESLERRLAADGGNDPRLTVSRCTVLALRRDATRAAEACSAAFDLVPVERALELPSLAQATAWNHVLLGRPEAAVQILDTLFDGPANISAGALRTDPRWATLRGRPEFERLIGRAIAVERQAGG